MDQYLAWLKKKEEQVQLTQPQGYSVKDAEAKVQYLNVSILISKIFSKYFIFKKSAEIHMGLYAIKPGFYSFLQSEAQTNHLNYRD